MATVIQPLIEPDALAIKSHLGALFLRVGKEYPDGLIELRHGQDGKINRSAYFGLIDAEIASAVDYAVSMNREGQNVYVGVNPRKKSTSRKGSASDTDVEIAFFQFADLDKKEAVDNARGDLPVKPSLVVITGTVPNNRPHLYWELEEPVLNMAAWTERQRGIAAALKGDAVINPSRIMRLAGTVNWPTQDKIGRGYKVEVCTFKSQFADERAPVSPEQIAYAYPPPAHSQAEIVQPLEGQNTLQAMRSTRTADLMVACRSGDEWHNNMVRLVAHLAAKGRTDAEILGLASGLTLPGYSVEQTMREMIAALQSARTKWNLPDPQDDVETEERARDDGESIFELLDLDAIEQIPPPTYLIEGVLPDDGLAIAYGDPGAGKSFIALDMALRLSYGMDWHGIEAKPCGVLYIAGEAQKGVANRIKGWRRQHDVSDVHAPFILLPVAVQLLDLADRHKLLRSIDAAIEMAGFHIGLIVVDTVSRALSGADENGQESMSAFVSACDEIKKHAGGAMLGVHHTGKDKEKGMRGSSVLLGACDAAFKITKDNQQIVTLATEKQKDSEEAEDIHLKLTQYEWAEQGLGKELTTLVPFRSEAPTQVMDSLSNEQIAKAFGVLADAWEAGKPLSMSPNTREQGRYAPSVLSNRIGCKEAAIKTFVVAWLENECLSIEQVDSHSKTKGLRVLKPITGWN